MATSFLSNSDARPIKEASGVSFESLIVKLESALNDAEDLGGPSFPGYDLSDVVQGIQGAIDAARTELRNASELKTIDPEEWPIGSGGGYIPGKQSITAPWVRGKPGHRVV